MGSRRAAFSTTPARPRGAQDGSTAIDKIAMRHDDFSALESFEAFRSDIHVLIPSSLHCSITALFCSTSSSPVSAESHHSFGADKHSKIGAVYSPRSPEHSNFRRSQSCIYVTSYIRSLGGEFGHSFGDLSL
jgi:hypothetical protein